MVFIQCEMVNHVLGSGEKHASGNLPRRFDHKCPLSGMMSGTTFKAL